MLDSPRIRVALAAVVLVASACGEEDSAAPSAERKTGAALSSGLTCSGTSVHEKHASFFACTTCHSCAGTYVFDPSYVFTGNKTTIADGTITLKNACVTPPTPTTCTVACHFPNGADGQPSPSKSIEWTKPGPLACTECHATSRLPATHPPVSDSATRAQCTVCHQMDGHMDGTPIVTGGHDPQTWMSTTNPGFHAYSANAGIASCQSCHGEALQKCEQCHGANWKTNCTMCHGSPVTGTGAPPEAKWGSTSTVAVGAHTSHVGPNPVSSAYGCVECHVTPTDALSPGHISGSAGVSFTGPVSGIRGGTWNYPVTSSPTCSSTYCHGNFTRGIATNAPNWNGTNQAACGTCHKSRPGAYLHQRHQRSYSGLGWWPLAGGSTWVTCDQCHSGIATSVNESGTPTLTVVGGAGPALHVNGRPDVVFKAGGTYELIAPFEGTCSSMACHPGEVKYWPR